MLKIDHIGYAVRSTEKAIRRFEALGYVFSDSVRDEDRNVIITFGEMDGCRIELVAPMGKGSPVDGILQSIGPSPYHICYSSDSFEEDIKRLESNGCRVTLSPSPAVAFGGRRVVFLYSLAFGLCEIVEA